MPPISSEIRQKYQPVIGLEIHIQLLTRTKIFGTEGFAFGAPPNYHVSPVTLAHPGALPSMNDACISQAIKMGLATNCEINPACYFARKNYFYPDLPKGYQISQDTEPICKNGWMDIRLADGTYKRIEIERIHLEEDAGKSIHDQSETDSVIDLNRAGVGLVELVTRPDLRSEEDAATFLAEIRKLARYLGVSDGNMEEGSLRCDANVSVMLKNATEYGTRVEIKNMNSFTFLARAINYEIDRQIRAIESGKTIRQETRTWDTVNLRTLPMRHKETADDYRYFPEPDLLPVRITADRLEAIRQEIPRLPQDLFREYHEKLEIPLNEALALTEHKGTSDYFESLRAATSDAKAAANWLLGPVKEYLNETGTAISDFPIRATNMVSLIDLVKSKQVSHSIAKEKIFPALIASPEKNPLDIAKNLDLLMESNESAIEEAMDKLIEAFPAETQRYRSGKKGLLGFFVGQLMRQFKGKADPKEVNKVVREKLG